MSHSILHAAVTTVMPAEHADVMPNYFFSDRLPLLVVRNKITDFHHILYINKDGDAQVHNVGNNADFSDLAIAAHAHNSIVHNVKDVLGNWDAVMKQLNHQSAEYVMEYIRAELEGC